MKKKNITGSIFTIPFFAFLISLFSLSLPLHTQATGFIVQFKDKESVSTQRQMQQSLGDSAQIIDTVEDLKVVLVETSDYDSGEFINELEKNKDIQRIEPNLSRNFTAFIPNDSSFSSQWSHRNTGQSINGSSGQRGADIDSTIAWEQEGTGPGDVVVAVIDTGVDYTHPDLAANMWNGASCLNDFGNTIAGGCPYHGWNYDTNNNNPIDSGQADSSYTGHGTFAASVVGAVSGNSQGISGFSRNNNLKIMALRFNFDVFSEIKAINFARFNGAKVINASYGGGGYSQIEADAIAAFPGILVAASGNGGSDFVGDDVDSSAFYPCNYNLPNIICVGATNQNDQLATFSNYGVSNVDIAAPGVNILGIYRGEYLYGNGTSFAAPLVSAAAGMAYINNPSLSRTQIKNIVLSQSDSVGALSGKIAGARRLNYAKILGAQVPTTDQPSDSAQQNTYRFYSPVYRSHFYTVSLTERDSLITSNPNWNYEGVGFKTYKAPINSSVKPVHRFYSKKFNSHFYTISEAERDLLINSDPNWNYEGPAYFASITKGTGLQPLFRFYSKSFKSHFFTISTAERDSIIANDSNWDYEGIAYYLPI